MIVKNSKEVACVYCKGTHTIREYFGLVGGWYSDHYCDAQRDASLSGRICPCSMPLPASVKKGLYCSPSCPERPRHKFTEEQRSNGGATARDNERQQGKRLNHNMLFGRTMRNA